LQHHPNIPILKSHINPDFFKATSLAFRIEASTASHNAVAKSLASSSWPRAAQLMCRMRQQQLDPNEITSGAAATATGSGGADGDGNDRGQVTGTSWIFMV